jgi:hypothetical protein
MQNNQMAIRPGAPTPENKTGRDACDSNPTQNKNSPPIVADLDADRKSFVTLRARFALAGFGLVELSNGSLLATRWNCCKPLPDATAAHRFLRQIGGTV